MNLSGFLAPPFGRQKVGKEISQPVMNRYIESIKYLNEKAFTFCLPGQIRRGGGVGAHQKVGIEIITSKEPLH